MKTKRPKRRVLPWAELLRRVFTMDVLICAVCGSELRVIAYITEEKIAEKILNHLGLPAEPLPLAPAKLPKQLDYCNGLQSYDSEENYPSGPPYKSKSRGPPYRVDGDGVAKMDATEDGDNWGA